ncbi:hypothetical protein A5790_14365 [Mycobacterium sp. 852002-51152_SCH6134967]|uniref:hypothetical protein n=1 Tax=Mycobacterium sp. 852002-51152_SCH6134967 TaxID=1834096 RepID=UPI0007FDE8F9|nr:hypothetical protein [Mycobacterium sp. 852002-51152_SCH6134967]OBF92332.1 hypothetical protein A5790_14365 [Mycobacterium sp. 852002-51152_SCH6134967]
MNARLAAGAGVVSVFLLVSGSGAVVAYAHPGDSRGSDRGHSADRGGGHHSRGSGNGKYDNDRRDGKRTTGSKRGGDTNGSGAAPKSRVGSGRDGLAQPSPDSRPGAVIAPESAGRAAAPDVSASRAAAAPDVSASRAAAAPDVSASRSAVGATPPAEVPVNTASSAAPVASGGSGAASAPAPAFEPPQVAFGNGRAPHSRDLQPETDWQPPALAPSAPVPAQPIPTTPLSPAPPAPAVLDPVATPPAVVRQFVVAPGAGTSDPLWGLAGLLLIPVAGAALGYRQARAAQAAERIGRP